MSLEATLVEQAIRARCTHKAVADIDHPLPPTDLHDTLKGLLETAGWAPFHKPAHVGHRQTLTSIVPWRFYALSARACRRLLETLKTWAADDPTWLQGKIPGMLAAADALVYVTWLPEPGAAEGEYSPNKLNTEHIAAAAAATQNLLLAATARGLHNYWSSGGSLGRPEVYDRLGIPHTERLLGSVFLFPDTAETITHGGSLRDQRGNLQDWARFIELA